MGFRTFTCKPSPNSGIDCLLFLRMCSTAALHYAQTSRSWCGVPPLSLAKSDIFGKLEEVLYKGRAPLVSGKADIRLPGKGNSNLYGARPVHQIISMITWIRTIRLSIKNALSTLPFPANHHTVHHVGASPPRKAIRGSVISHFFF